VRNDTTDEEQIAHLQAGLFRSMPRPLIRTARQCPIRSAGIAPLRGTGFGCGRT